MWNCCDGSHVNLSDYLLRIDTLFIITHSTDIVQTVSKTINTIVMQTSVCVIISHSIVEG